MKVAWSAVVLQLLTQLLIAVLVMPFLTLHVIFREKDWSLLPIAGDKKFGMSLGPTPEVS